LMEIGKVFLRSGDDVDQPRYLSMLAMGAKNRKHWNDNSRKTVDFFAMKGDVEQLLQKLHLSTSVRWVEDQHVLLHPGQTASLEMAGEKIARLGVLHPSWVRDLGLTEPPVLFELNLDKILSSSVPQYREISKYPEVSRDLSVIVPQDLCAAELLLEVREVSDNLLDNVEIFDVYQGQGIDSDKKSVALCLTFIDPSRTLIDSEIDQAMANVFRSLQEKFNATMRT